MKLDYSSRTILMKSRVTVDILNEVQRQLQFTFINPANLLRPQMICIALNMEGLKSISLQTIIYEHKTIGKKE